MLVAHIELLRLDVVCGPSPGNAGVGALSLDVVRDGEGGHVRGAARTGQLEPWGG